MPRLRLVSRPLGSICCALLSAAGVFAQPPPATGTIEGRVLNVSSRSYVNNARLTVEGTALEAFTDEFGEYRLQGVPLGEARLTAFFTGLAPQSAVVVVTRDRAVRRDFELDRVGAARPEGATVQLGEFVVAAERETNAAALAINEQRFAANLKNVVSADAFGESTEGNLGEFVKYLPGIVPEITGHEARAISVRGLPSDYTPILIDGASAASAQSSGTGRSVETTAFPMNNIARVEVSKSPTPDARADSLGGSVDVISKNAFERRKPLFSYSVYATAKDDYLSLREYPAQIPGVGHRRVLPSFSASYVAPVSRTFGFSIAVARNDRFTESKFLRTGWIPFGSASAAATATAPILRTFYVQNQPSRIERNSLSLGFDWKARPEDVFSANFQTFRGTVHQAINNLTWDTGTGAGLAGDATRTRGANGGTVTFNMNHRQKVDGGAAGTVRFQHSGRIWRLNAAASFSRSFNYYNDANAGFFGNTVWRLSNVVVNYDGIRDVEPARVSVFSAGVPVNSYDASNFRVISAANDNTKQSLDVVESARASAQRDLGLAVPLRVKAGVDVRRQDRDIRSPNPAWTFVGPDRVGNTADDNVALRGLLDPSGYSREKAPFNQPLITWPSPDKLLGLFKEHPEYFTQTVSQPIASSANNSRKITETVSAAYLRADARLFHQRLLLTGGVRFERTDDDGYGVLNDLRNTYEQDANGNLRLDANGRPFRRSTDPVVLANLQYQDRGAHVRRHYDGYYPSLNSTFNLTENTLLRAAYARTLGRPSFGRIIPGVSVTDPTAANPTITLNNTGLKPWTADNFDLAIERYFEAGGLVSVGVFRKNIRDFFGSTRSAATAESLAQFGLPDDYLGYDLVTTTNSGSAEISGAEFDFRQRLTFLPRWARGAQVFFNATSLHLAGNSTSDFSQFVRRSVNWGVNFSRPRFTVSLNWNFRDRQRGSLLTGTNIPPGTYSYVAPRLSNDVSAEVRLRRGVSLFFTGRNITNEVQKEQRYNAATPYYARNYGYTDTGAFFTLGVKGEF